MYKCTCNLPTPYTLPANEASVPQPSSCYNSDFMGEYSIGVDLGGTNLRAAAINRSRGVLAKISGAAHLSQGRAAVLADTVDSVRELREHCGTPGLTDAGSRLPCFI